jgi:hypothetical protein
MQKKHEGVNVFIKGLVVKKKKNHAEEEGVNVVIESTLTMCF